MGLPGSGKTFFASAFSKRIGATHINSDGVRKELNKNPTYTTRDKETVYQSMFNKVSEELTKGKTVIVDATFSRKRYREPYFEIVKEHGIPYYIIFVEANKNTIAKRLSKKRPDSDADLAVHNKIKAEYEELEMDHLVLQSDQLSLEEMITSALDFIKLKKKAS